MAEEPRSDVTPLVLVHGCGTDRHFWDELLPHLSELEVLAPSLPGRAETGGDAVESAEEAATWLHGYLRSQSVERAIVVGHSFGGAVAIEAALQSGREGGVVVEGLGLVATGARLRVLPAILEAVTAAVETGVPADLGRFAYHRDADEALIERVEGKARHTPVESTRRDWFATNAFDRLGQLSSIQARTVVVCGTEDTLTPAKYSQYFVDHIAGARLELIEGTGHMLPVEQPARLAAALRLLLDP